MDFAMDFFAGKEFADKLNFKNLRLIAAVFILVLRRAFRADLAVAKSPRMTRLPCMLLPSISVSFQFYALLILH